MIHVLCVMPSVWIVRIPLLTVHYVHMGTTWWGIPVLMLALLWGPTLMIVLEVVSHVVMLTACSVSQLTSVYSAILILCWIVQLVVSYSAAWAHTSGQLVSIILGIDSV